MKRFVIYCPFGRCGSTLLGSLLNAHPCIHCDGELFRLGRWRQPLQPLVHVLRCFPLPYVRYRQARARLVRHASAYGFKLFSIHLKQSAAFVERLYSSGWSVIYLHRDSLFDSVVSTMTAKTTRRWNGCANRVEPEDSILSIDPFDFHNVFRQKRESSRQFHEFLSTLPHLPLVYEDDLASPECWTATVSKICNYLGLEAPTGPVTTHLCKPWSRPYSEIVANYDELRAIAQQEIEKECKN